MDRNHGQVYSGVSNCQLRDLGGCLNGCHSDVGCHADTYYRCCSSFNKPPCSRATPPGSYCNTTTLIMTLCPVGQYSAPDTPGLAWLTSCLVCPAGKSTHGAGATACFDIAHLAHSAATSGFHIGVVLVGLVAAAMAVFTSSLLLRYMALRGKEPITRKNPLAQLGEFNGKTSLRPALPGGGTHAPPMPLPSATADASAAAAAAAMNGARTADVTASQSVRVALRDACDGRPGLQHGRGEKGGKRCRGQWGLPASFGAVVYQERRRLVAALGCCRRLLVCRQCP